MEQKHLLEAEDQALPVAQHLVQACAISGFPNSQVMPTADETDFDAVERGCHGVRQHSGEMQAMVRERSRKSVRAKAPLLENPAEVSSRSCRKGHMY